MPTASAQDRRSPRKSVLLRTKNGTLTAGILPFIILQFTVLLVFTTYFSWTGLAICALSYAVRMFAITGFYHRYFSHRTYKMGRPMQFFAAVLGCTATQKGPLWWAAHHRGHHKHSDTPDDPHSSHEGFFHSHFLWFLYEESNVTHYDRVKDLTKYPELMFLNRYWVLSPVLYAVGLFMIGGWHWVVWGYFVSTVLLGNGTYTINSLMHSWGKQYFVTGDKSRNHWLLAIITLGEGWHNNHHRYQASARNGFYWYEYDITYYTLKALSWVGLVRDLNPVPFKILEEGRINHQRRRQAQQQGLAFEPARVLRQEVQGLSQLLPPRVRDLRTELLTFCEMADKKRRGLAAEMQGLGEQVGHKLEELQEEIAGLGGQMAKKSEPLRAEVQRLGDQVAEQGKALRQEMQALNDQVSEKTRQLANEIQALGEQMVGKGKMVKADFLELSEHIGDTIKELRSNGQELSDEVSAWVRTLRAQVDTLGGQLGTAS